MDAYKELGDRLRGIATGHKMPTMMQGIVRSVEGTTCSVEVEGLVIPDVRLRASGVEGSGELIIIPAIGSVVLLGSLSGDLSELAVLSVDKAERIRLSGEITINDGSLGGLVNIHALTDKINALISHLNSHNHTASPQGGPTSPPMQQAQMFNVSDYEDKQIQH